MKNLSTTASSLLVVSAAVLLASTAMAQTTTRRRGMAAAWPAGVLVKDLSSASQNPNAGVRVKPAQDQTSNNQIIPAPVDTLDSYRLERLIPSKFLTGPNPIELDAISTGNGIIPGHDHGVPELGGGWLGITVSVAHRVGNDVGVPGSHFRMGYNRRGSAGAELVTYYMEQSVGINHKLPGASALETNRLQFGFDSSPNPANTRYDISALDYGIGVFDQSTTLPQSLFFHERGKFFFSVTKHWADARRAESGEFIFAEDVDHSNVEPYGSDIYMMELVETGWEGPYLYASGTTLGFDRAAGELDALDVDSRSANVLFSGALEDTITRSLGGPTTQLLIINLDPNPANTYRSAVTNQQQPFADNVHEGPPPGGQTFYGAGLGSELGVGGDEIDAICSIDPEAGQFGAVVGTPTASNDGAWGEPLGMSTVLTDVDGDGYHEWQIQVNGWGDLPPAGGNVMLLVRHDDETSRDNYYPRGWDRIGVVYRAGTEDAVAKFEVPSRRISPNVAPGTDLGTKSFIAVQLNPAGNAVVGGTWTSTFVRYY